MATLRDALKQQAKPQNSRAVYQDVSLRDYDGPLATFDRTVHPAAERAWTATKAWCYAVTRKEMAGLILWSSGYGVGKTHLARAAAAWVASCYDVDGLQQKATFLRTVDFFQTIKDCYATDQPVGGYLDALAVRPLILDDMGKEYFTASGAAWGREQFYRLIDRMYAREIGLFVTSNMAPVEIMERVGGAAWSRLIEMCHGERGIISMDDIPDYRMKAAQ